MLLLRKMKGKPKTPASFYVRGIMSNPRYKNGNLRRKYRARFKAMQLPCGICKGRLGPIHYDEPSNYMYPLSFVIDEIIPVSRWKEFGYSSPEAVANDYSNLQPAHYCCNEAKSNKTSAEMSKKAQKIKRYAKVSDGKW